MSQCSGSAAEKLFPTSPWTAMPRLSVLRGTTTWRRSRHADSNLPRLRASWPNDGVGFPMPSRSSSSCSTAPGTAERRPRSTSVRSRITTSARSAPKRRCARRRIGHVFPRRTTEDRTFCANIPCGHLERIPGAYKLRETGEYGDAHLRQTGFGGESFEGRSSSLREDQDEEHNALGQSEPRKRRKERAPAGELPTEHGGRLSPDQATSCSSLGCASFPRPSPSAVTSGAPR